MSSQSVKDAVLSMISLDYDDTIMAAAGHQAEAILEETRAKYKGQYVLAVEGNPPLNEDGMFCFQGGRPFVEKLKEAAVDAKAIISHRLPLDNVSEAYEMFAAKQDDCRKIVLYPHGSQAAA